MDAIVGLAPSRQTWQLVVKIFGYFPLITVPQWLSDYRPSGRTSIDSKLNIPGKLAWMTMEVPGFVALLGTMVALSRAEGISPPWQNWLMASLYTIHYTYRAILFPLLAPSMSPIHFSIWAAAFVWNVVNGLSLGGWLGGYGPRTHDDWDGQILWIQLGLTVWAFGFLGNIFHDDELREIRRASARKQAAKVKREGTVNVDKVYEIPKNGLFRFIFYPHYLCEWIEWAGYWMMAGAACVPARNFLINEVTTMFPLALSGRRWYVQKFGEKRVGNTKAIIPGIL